MWTLAKKPPTSTLPPELTQPAQQPLLPGACHDGNKAFAIDDCASNHQ